MQQTWIPKCCGKRVDLFQKVYRVKSNNLSQEMDIEPIRKKSIKILVYNIP